MVEDAEERGGKTALYLPHRGKGRHRFSKRARWQVCYEQAARRGCCRSPGPHDDEGRDPGTAAGLSVCCGTHKTVSPGWIVWRGVVRMRANHLSCPPPPRVSCNAVAPVRTY